MFISISMLLSPPHWEAVLFHPFDPGFRSATQFWWKLQHGQWDPNELIILIAPQNQSRANVLTPRFPSPRRLHLQEECATDGAKMEGSKWHQKFFILWGEEVIEIIEKQQAWLDWTGVFPVFSNLCVLWAPILGSRFDVAGFVPQEDNSPLF